MKTIRTTIPNNTAVQLLFANRRRCCICREARKPVHIHHIDEDPSNNEWDNLAVLCLDHHSDVTGNQGLGRNYTQAEISLYKENWEEQCARWRSNSEADTGSMREDETVEPIQSFTKRVNLGDDEHYPQEFNLEEEDEITFSVSSDEPIDFMIMTKRQYNRWAKDGEGRLYVEHSDITALEDSFEVPQDGIWVLVFCNDSDQQVVIDFDISTWPGE